MRNNWLSELVIAVVFILANCFFHWFDWASVVGGENTNIIGIDLSMAEFNIESVYRQARERRDIFVFEKKQLYPYTINIALSDPGVANLIIYYPLRLWFSPSQAVRLVMIANTLLASFLMYLFLRKVKVRREFSIILALIFAYGATAPFRHLGHYTYTAVYIFPLGAWALLKWDEAKDSLATIGWASFWGVYGAYVLMLNFYYFIALLIGGGLICIYSVWRNKFLVDWRKIGTTLPITGAVMITLLFPWISAVWQFTQIDSQAPVVGFAGAMELEGDLLGFLTPSKYHWWYQQVAKIFPWNDLVAQNSDHSIYLSIFVLFGITAVIINFKKLSSKIREAIAPYGMMVIAFGLLVLGPFLKVAGKIAVNLEGVSVVIPLPFLLLHYLPGMSGLRAPARFFPVLVFSVLVWLGIAATGWIKHQVNNRWKIWTVLFSLVILVEIYTIPTKNNTQIIPTELYKIIENDSAWGTVLEIPFVVRDGFEYLGEKDAIVFQNGSLTYSRPVLGGYFARLHPDLFAYYYELPFTGQILDLLKAKPTGLENIDIQDVQKELDFLDVRYIILRDNEVYTPAIKQILTKIPSELITTTQGYALYKVESVRSDFSQVKLGVPTDYLFTALGFGPREQGYRAIVQEKAKLFWKTSSDASVVSITASSVTPRTMKVYMGESRLGEIEIVPERKNYRLKIQPETEGIQIITFVIEGLKDQEAMNSQNGVKIYAVGTL